MRKTRRIALLVFLLSFAVYLFPIAYDLFYRPFFNWAPSQDIVSTSLLPIEIIERGDFTLDRYREFIAKTFRDPYFVVIADGRIISRYPVAAAVLAVPFYGVPLGTGWIANPSRDWLEFPISAFFPAKFAAALMAALAVLMFFYCARELTDVNTSAALAIVFAFGTSVWSTASQALWQQTPSILLQLIGVWFVLRGRRAGVDSLAPAAFFFSAATVARANDVFSAALFTLYVLLEYRSAKLLVKWIAWAIPPLVFFLWYNWSYNGSPFVFGYQDGFANYLHLPSLSSIAGLFISPSRGLFVYSPFLVFAILGAWHARREPARRFYLFSTLAFLATALLVSVWENWDGGWGYGTRMLTDVIPFAVFLLIPLYQRLTSWKMIVFWMLTVLAMILHAFSLWDYGVRWHWSWDNYAYDVWSIERSEPLFYLREYLGMANQYLQKYIFRP